MLLGLIGIVPVGAMSLNDPGDVDGDGVITASDARLALRYSAKLIVLTEHERSAADIDKDGNVTASDARTILRISAKLEPIPSAQPQTEHPILARSNRSVRIGDYPPVKMIPLDFTYPITVPVTDGVYRLIFENIHELDENDLYIYIYINDTAYFYRKVDGVVTNSDKYPKWDKVNNTIVLENIVINGKTKIKCSLYWDDEAYHCVIN
jgi:hypothetical protein